MSKELEALEALKEIRKKCGKIIVKSMWLPNSYDYEKTITIKDYCDFIEKTLKEKEKQDEILRIIKEKKVNVGYLLQVIDLFGVEKALKTYNQSCFGIIKPLTQEEYDLLKEVLL